MLKSAVFAYSTIPSMLRRLLSARCSAAAAWLSASFCAHSQSSCSFNITSPLRAIYTISVWCFDTRTTALFSLAFTVTRISSLSPSSIAFTLNGTLFKYSAISFCSSGVTFAITSRHAFESPATIPAAAAAGIPFMPPVFGTITLFTFLIILPLASMITSVGIWPNTSLAFAAQYASAIGSVQPNAGVSSSRKICSYVLWSSLVSITIFSIFLYDPCLALLFMISIIAFFVKVLPNFLSLIFRFL